MRGVFPEFSETIKKEVCPTMSGAIWEIWETIKKKFPQFLQSIKRAYPHICDTIKKGEEQRPKGILSHDRGVLSDISDTLKKHHRAVTLRKTFIQDNTTEQ